MFSPMLSMGLYTDWFFLSRFPYRCEPPIKAQINIANGYASVTFLVQRDNGISLIRRLMCVCLKKVNALT